MTLLNANPTIFESDNSSRINRIQNLDETIVDEFDAQEIFDLIRNINDPEHPLTLEQLNVAQLGLIHVDNIEQTITVKFTPTIPHCSMATLIGLCIRVRLLRCIPPRFKVTVLVSEGSHQSEDAGILFLLFQISSMFSCSLYIFDEKCLRFLKNFECE
ncbi:hypothetical protein HMI55_004638 [Coelomomyces lativittatus]|nr:hypothetical protein HMI55_004638 [Coelomomyces lativittatus]